MTMTGLEFVIIVKKFNGTKIKLMGVYLLGIRYKNEDYYLEYPGGLVVPIS